MMWLIVAHVTLCLLVVIGLGFVVAVRWLSILAWRGVDALRDGLPELRSRAWRPRTAPGPGITAQGPAESRFAAFAASVRQHRNAA